MEVCMDKLILSKIFYDVYRNLTYYNYGDTNQKRINNSMIIYDNQEFERTLENFITQIMGYSVFRKYERYRDGLTDSFEYFGELRQYFESIIANASHEKLLDLDLWVNDYVHNYIRELDNHPFVNIFIKAAKRTLSTDEVEVFVRKDGKKYTIGILNNRRAENMPYIIVDDIDNLEKILCDYIDNINITDNFYKKPMLEMGFDEDSAVEFIIYWTLINATALDLESVEAYFSKYNLFITDKNLDMYRGKPKYLGNLLGDELYLLLKKATVAYETPYYLSFMMKNRRVELPNIRMGIEDYGDGRAIAHIIATQSSQMLSSKEQENELNKIIKQFLPKSKYFREYNPSHLVSLVLTIGLLKARDINIIRFPNYIPLRYRKQVLEGNKNEEEIDRYQHRLTNKFTNNFLRMVEVSEGIEISSYPENGNVTELKLGEEIKFNNEFLDKLYTMAYESTLNYMEEEDLKCNI